MLEFAAALIVNSVHGVVGGQDNSCAGEITQVIYACLRRDWIKNSLTPPYVAPYVLSPALLMSLHDVCTCRF